MFVSTTTGVSLRPVADNICLSRDASVCLDDNRVQKHGVITEERFHTKPPSVDEGQKKPIKSKQDNYISVLQEKLF